MTDLTPREIVSELDRFIIGQAEAKRAVAGALRIDREVARARGMEFTWRRCAEMFVANLQPFDRYIARAQAA